MPTLPLTHHEIIGLVEPFTRRGRHVDLAASNRQARQLVFKPLAAVAEAAPGSGLVERLQLDSLGTGSFRLTRVSTRSNGAHVGLQAPLQATLQAMGPKPGDLLAQIEAVPAQQQFQSGAGFELARSFDLGWITGAPQPGRTTDALVLSAAVLQLEGLLLNMVVPAVKGVAADISLSAAPGQVLELPPDLLAVLGWDWSHLVPNASGWTSKLRLRGKAARRSQKAEAALATAAKHLAQVLAQPPAQFHRQFLWARWGVVGRRAIPSLTAIALIATALLLPRFTGDQNAGLWMALHYVPIALLALSFSLQELARFEIPPLPRRLRAAQWRQPLPPADAGGRLVPGFNR